MADQSPFQMHSFKFDEPGDMAAYQRLIESGKVELFAIGINAESPDHLLLKLGPMVIPMHPEIAEKLVELKAEKETGR